MVMSGWTWFWLLAHTVEAADSEMWTIRTQRSLALFLFAGAYYLFAQKPRR